MKQQFSEPEAQRIMKSIQQHSPQMCPRCESLNTKFCYYNNYSLSQPRYFCKTCRRYWTQGGTLRNVPIGGGCRKGKRPKLSSPIPSSLPISVNQQEQEHHILASDPVLKGEEQGYDQSGSYVDYQTGGGFLSEIDHQGPISDLIGGCSSNFVPFYGVNFNPNPNSGNLEQRDSNLVGNLIYPSGNSTMSIIKNNSGSSENNKNRNVVGSTSASSSCLTPNLWSDHQFPGYGPP